MSDRTKDLEAAQRDPNATVPQRPCSKCGQPCNVEVCAACARTSNPVSIQLRTQECVTRARNDDHPLPYQRVVVHLADEIERLREIIRNRGRHAESCDFHGECRCELLEFQS